MTRRRADHRRIAELERWHAHQDCLDRGHTLPEGYTEPTPADLAGVRETWDITTVAATAITSLELPAGLAEVACEHCGTHLIARFTAGGDL